MQHGSRHGRNIKQFICTYKSEGGERMRDREREREHILAISSQQTWKMELWGPQCDEEVPLKTYQNRDRDNAVYSKICSLPYNIISHKILR